MCAWRRPHAILGNGFARFLSKREARGWANAQNENELSLHRHAMQLLGERPELFGIREQTHLAGTSTVGRVVRPVFSEPAKPRRSRADLYRERAAEARAKAADMSPEHRGAMLEIAATWERMAELDEQLGRPPGILSRTNEKAAPRGGP
jgi:hypothetical protein